MKELQLKPLRLSKPLWAALALLPGCWLAHAQYFQYTSHGDLLAGFRKPGAGNYELVVNIGNITNLLALSPGSTLALTAYSPAQLSDSFSSFGGLQWSVSATVVGAPGSTWDGFGRSTIWYTLPRQAAEVPTSAPARLSSHNQASISRFPPGTRTPAAGTRAVPRITSVPSRSTRMGRWALPVRHRHRRPRHRRQLSPLQRP